jgi:glycogen(starch) synthase
VSPPARILMTADTVGGVWTYAVDLAAGLAASGVRTTLVTLGPSPSDDQQAEAAAIPGLDLIDTRLPLDWAATEPAEIEETAAAVRGLARSARADLVHLNSPALATAGFPMPVLGACHSCLATWWAAVKEGDMPDDFRWRTRALWRGMLACDALAAPSLAFARTTAQLYEIPIPFVVHNGRRPSRGAAAERESVVFTAGRLWDEGKNAGVLDAAAGLCAIPVMAAGPLVSPIDGAGPAFRNLRPLGLLSAEAVQAQMDRSLIYASSALYEPFGLGVLEAAQAGCALVLSDVPTFRELWDGVAIFAAPRDSSAFAQAFDALAADPPRARALGQAARSRAKRFSADAMTARVLHIYSHLALASGDARRARVA